MILQNPKTGHQYVFELKDRLIRDEEFDGWKEIPLKRDNIWVWSGADACLPGSLQFTAIWLNHLFRFISFAVLTTESNAVLSVLR